MRDNQTRLPRAGFSRLRSARPAGARFSLRVVAVLLAGLAGAAGCGFGKQMTRAEGDGGWSQSERRDELSKRADAAGVDLTGAGVTTTHIPSASSEPRPAPSTPGVSAASRPLTLADALALAAAGNRRIAASAQQVERARQQVRNARGRLLPQTTASARYNWYTDPLTNEVTLAAELPGLETPTVTIRDDEAGTVNATLTLPLDVTGELRHTLAAAQAGYRGEEARRWATVLAQQTQVANAYYALLEAERFREVTKQTIASQRRQLDSAQAQFSSGRATKNDMLVVQVTVSNSEQRLVANDLAIAHARMQLNEAVGLPVNAPTTVMDVTVAPAVPSADQALEQTWRHNPVVLSLLEEQQRIEATVTALERSRFPRFAGGGAYDWTSSDIFEPQDYGTGFVGMTWDIGTDGRRVADIAAAKADAERNRLELEGEMRAIEAAVRLAALGVEERLAAYAAAREAVSQADENLRIREQQFDVGRATSDDVLTAVAILSRERATAATALYQAHARAAELNRLIGLSLDGTGAQGH